MAATDQPVVETPTPLILLVDDEPTLRESIAFNLKREGWTVAVAEDGPTALAMARAIGPDLVILDIMLPGMDGLQVCRALRTESNVPILFLSARAEDVDRILGLELGGDDYITKPFVMRELVARVRANLRRSIVATRPSPVLERPAPSPNPTILQAGRLRLDPASRTVSLHGVPVALKPMEYALLEHLMSHPGVALSRAVLLRDVWRYDYPVDTRTVDVHIRALREKIEIEPAMPELIQTVRRFGYRFAARDRASLRDVADA